MLRGRSTIACRRLYGMVSCSILRLWLPTAYSDIQRGDTVVGHPVPTEETVAQVATGRIHIAFEAPKDWRSTARARVHVEYVMRNPSNALQRLHLGFPVFGCLREEVKGPWFTARLDSKPLDVREVQLADPIASLREDDEFMSRCAQLLEEWTQSVPGLPERIGKLREVRRSLDETREAASLFRTELRKYLKDDGHIYKVLNFAGNPTRFANVAAMMPVVDPSISVANKKLASHEKCANEWRRRAQDWLSSKPGLSKLADAFREHRETQRRDSELRKELALFLHDKCDLDTGVLIGLADYYPSRSRRLLSPGTLGRIFPSVREEVARREKSKVALLRKWHWDPMFVSPLTGELYDPCSGAFGDPTPSLLGEASTSRAPLGTSRGMSEWLLLPYGLVTTLVPYRRRPIELRGSPPKIMKCSFTMQPHAEAILAVGYATLTNYDGRSCYGRHRRVSCRLPQFSYTLKTEGHWRSFGPVSIIIAAPDRYYAVITPAPSQAVNENGQRRYSMSVRNPDANLHIALVEMPTPRRHVARLSDLLEPTAGNLARLQDAADRVTHPQALPLLRAAIADTYGRLGLTESAWKAYSALAQENSFPPAAWRADGLRKRVDAERARAASRSSSSDRSQYVVPYEDERLDDNPDDDVRFADAAHLWDQLMDPSSPVTVPAEREAIVQELLRRRGEGEDVLEQVPGERVFDSWEANPWVLNCVTRFGEAGVQRLLDLSADRSQLQRSAVARVLSSARPEDFGPIRRAAAAGQDLSQRKTALLAIAWAKDAESLPILERMLAEKGLRRSVIATMGEIGDDKVVPSLLRLRREIMRSRQPDFRSGIWLNAIDDALNWLGQGDDK